MGQASCTLEAGVKIYSVRVDAVHSEAYKVLGRITRAGLEEKQEIIEDGDTASRGQDRGQPKKESDKKISPLSTLESSYEALNVKKFDVAFVVDPLYHQTSAQFDEGGAKGLLLNNLALYGGCQVLFDSFEVPGKCMSLSLRNNSSDMIDLSFAKESIEQIAVSMPTKNEISPSLMDIICHLDEENQRSSESFNVGEKFDSRADVFDADHVELDCKSFGNYEPETTFNPDENAFDESFSFGSTSQSNHEAIDPCEADEPDVDQSFENVATFLFQGLGITSKQNSWAGPDHWKFRKKGPEDLAVAESGPKVTIKRSKNRNLEDLDIDFMSSLDREMPDIFAAPKNPKSLLLHSNRAQCNNTLPEDCHYQPENLVKLFLLPNVLCLGKKRRKLSDCKSPQEKNDIEEPLPLWDNESTLSGQYDDGYFGSVEADELVSQPRQVNKVEVQYDKSSKQVDVHALKETLWDHIQESIEVPETVCEDSISFKYVLATFPPHCQAATLKDISPHLCFICLLHLANEHGLGIKDCPTLDDLSICLSSRRQTMVGLEQIL